MIEIESKWICLECGKEFEASNDAQLHAKNDHLIDEGKEKVKLLVMYWRKMSKERSPKIKEREKVKDIIEESILVAEKAKKATGKVNGNDIELVLHYDTTSCDWCLATIVDGFVNTTYHSEYQHWKEQFDKLCKKYKLQEVK